MNTSLLATILGNPIVAFVLFILISRLHIGSIGTYEKAFIKRRRSQLISTFRTKSPLHRNALIHAATYSFTIINAQSLELFSIY